MHNITPLFSLFLVMYLIQTKSLLKVTAYTISNTGIGGIKLLLIYILYYYASQINCVPTSFSLTSSQVTLVNLDQIKTLHNIPQCPWLLTQLHSSATLLPILLLRATYYSLTISAQSVSSGSIVFSYLSAWQICIHASITRSSSIFPCSSFCLLCS